MVTHNDINLAIRDALSDCYTGDSPYACLTERIAALKQQPEWTPEATARVEGKAVRMLAILLEPDGHA